MATPTTEISNVPHRAPDVRDICVPEAVAAQAERRPNAIAVASGAATMTYSELDSQADLLARRLRSMGAGVDVPVGLCLPRTPQMVMAALAIMKAGSPYLPMDPDYPADRLAFILEDAGASVLVTNSCLAARFPDSQNKMLVLDCAELSESDSLPEGTLPSAEPSGLAYVIYTSGSTGKPKGVELTHAGLSNLVSWHRQAFGVTAEDRASHVAGLSFDAAVWEIWPYLASGASLHLADDVTRTSPELLRDWLVERGITIGFVPTPIAERMLPLEWPENTPLRALLTGGDLLRRYPPPGLPFRVINNYGPTECTVVATSGEVMPEKHAETLPDIGCSIANARVYLLDERGQPVSQTGSGEIYIGGTGVARGYCRQPELTAEKFLPDPFHEEPGQRMYRTGDRGRMLPGGRIAFLGRIDDQIKIRGYRIEPGEIVAALSRHPSVRESLVMAREDTPGEIRLVCYVMPHPEVRLASAELRGFLRASLPEYMIPEAFVRLDAFPLTSHGKIDRSALPPPGPGNTLPDEWLGPRPFTPTQRRVADIAAGLLNRESVGLDDNFFLLGGHSLLGAQLIARLRDAFGIEISLRNLFGAPTVAQLAQEIERLTASPTAQSGPAAA